MYTYVHVMYVQCNVRDYWANAAYFSESIVEWAELKSLTCTVLARHELATCTCTGTLYVHVHVHALCTHVLTVGYLSGTCFCVGNNTRMLLTNSIQCSHAR